MINRDSRPQIRETTLEFVSSAYSHSVVCEVDGGTSLLQTVLCGKEVKHRLGLKLVASFGLSPKCYSVVTILKREGMISLESEFMVYTPC